MRAASKGAMVSGEVSNLTACGRAGDALKQLEVAHEHVDNAQIRSMLSKPTSWAASLHEYLDHVDLNKILH